MYRNAYWDGFAKNIKLRTWDDDGNRVTIDEPFKPYLYIEDINGDEISVFDTKLTKIEFNTTGDRKKYILSSNSNRFFDNFQAEQQFLLNRYWKEQSDDGFGKYPLRILFLDIEVDFIEGGEFPNPNEAKSEINLITVYDTLAKKYYVFGKGDYKSTGILDELDIEYVNCVSEKNLLKNFIRLWKSNQYPDIVTAWNLNGFDMPFICNRILKVLGEDYYKSLSPYNNVRTTIVKDKMFRDLIVYDVCGVAIMDYIDVYVKFKLTKQESYKLDFIAEKELGFKKLDYNGMTIYEFMEREWNRFVEYNIRDVELLVKMDEKLRYFDLCRMISNFACVNYKNGLKSIPITNGGIYIKAKQASKVLHTFERVKTNVDKAGGFCQAKEGLHEDIVTFDATSLYPNIIISCNISPETKVGMVESGLGEGDDIVHFRYCDKNLYKLKRVDFEKFLKTKNLIMAFNGCIFSQESQGFFPQYIEEIFNKRVEAKKEMKKLKIENEKLKLLLTKQMNN